MESVLVLVATVFFELLVSSLVRWVARKMHLEGIRERILRRLEQAKFRHPKNTLTEKEIIDHKIIRSVDKEVISSQITRRIQRGLAHWGIIVRDWDAVLGTPLKLEWQQFFVRLSSVLSEFVVPNLNRHYDEISVACFVILPYPRNKKHKPMETFQQAFEECLGSQPINREYISTAMLERKILPQYLDQIRKGENIIVLQPIAMKDQYLQKSIELIQERCLGSVHEVITILDGSGRAIDSRSKNPHERVLLELNLSNLQHEQ